MGPRSRITVPVNDKGILYAPGREAAADTAASSLMNTPVLHWQLHRPSSLLAIAHCIGNADDIRAAAREVFLALTEEGISYREYRMKTAAGNGDHRVSYRTLMAVHEFYRVIESSPDLQGMGLGRGELLLAPFDHHVTRYLRQRSIRMQNQLAS